MRSRGGADAEPGDHQSPAANGATDNGPRPTAAVVRMHLVGANPNARVATTDELPSKTNYFIGNDRKKWRTNVPTYARVRYHDVYPGIDLVYYGNQSGQVEYDFVVAPGADPKAISLAVAADSSRQGDVKSPLQIAANGDLIINGSGVRFHKPVVFQPSARPEPLLPSPDPNPKSEIQNRKFLDGRYIFTADNQIRFELGPYDHTKPLVIDPAIVYSTLLGGATFQSSATAIAVFADPATGHVYAYVAGETCAPDFPTVNAEQSTYASGCSITTNGDAFVTKFDPAASGGASVVYSTYLGGSGPDSASGIAVDSAGNAYVVGNTQSTSFPTMNAYQTATHAPVGPYGYTAGNAFLAKLSADGSTLLYSTYFGGSGVYGDGASAIAVDTAGRAYIVGGTSSTDLPTVNPYQAGPAGDFLAIFDTSQSPAAQLLYSTYLSAAFNAVAVDATNSVHLAGSAYSTFPAVNGVQTAPKTGPSAALYAKLNPAASGSAQLVYSTYLGGGLPGDTVHGIALDPAGNVYLSGSTFGGVFPVTAGAYQTALLTPVGYPSAFVAKINPSLSGGASLIYSTLLSGPGVNGLGSASGIAVDANGNAFVTGSMGPGLPLVNPVMGPVNGVFQSLDAGHSWIALTQGLGTAFPITALAIDASTSPRTLYVGTGMGGNGAIYTSADGGLNWTQVFQVPSSSGSSCTFDEGYTSTPCVMALAVDPSTPPNVYAGTSQGVYKSADRGATWTQFNTGLSGVAAEGVRALLFDSGTFWAGAGDGLYKLSSGATSWTATTLNADVEYIAADPTTTPHTLYTSSQWGSGNSYKSTDGGATWNNIWITAGAGAAPIAVDTSTSPSTLYASSPYSNANFSLPMFKSVDGGNTWEPLVTRASLTR